MSYGVAKNPKTDKRKKRRLYLSQDEYQTLFAAAWNARTHAPENADANLMISEYVLRKANEDLRQKESES